MTKGKQVYVEDRLLTRSYDDKDGKKVCVTDEVGYEVILLGGESQARSNDGAPPQSSSARNQHGGLATSRTATAAEEDFGGLKITDDDIPFDG